MVQTYYDPNLFKTDASASVIYDILKKYKKDNYDKDYLRNVNTDSYKYNILQKEIKVNPIFIESISTKSVKFLPNPTKNWGPKGKAKVVKYVNKII